MKLYSVILCGGRGERFWPRSRWRQPKQFITLFGRRSLLQATSDRVRSLCPLSRQLLVAGREFAPVLRRQLPVPRENLVFEPYGRNTAPAIGLAAARLLLRDRDATMAVLPADHLVEDRAAFVSCLRFAAKLAGQGRLVTFGIPPERPDTGYGYVQVGAPVARHGRVAGYEVRGFREKPDLATARRYLRSGDYCWNSGMFVWRADAILEAFRRHMPAFHESLARYSRAVGGRRERSELERLYREADSVSIDYAVMEKADNIAVVRATFDWDDVGSWLALDRHLPSDKQGNIIGERCVATDSGNCIVQADAGVVAVLGCSDLVVVRSGDAVLVARKDGLGGIKKLLAEVRARQDLACSL